MRKMFVLLAAIIIIINLTACKNPIIGKNEIDKINFVRVIGLDKLQKSNNIKITIASPRINTTGIRGEFQQRHTNILTSEGRTVFEALRKLRIYSDRKIFLGHIDFIIIGEEAAKDDILKYLDLLTRDHELRLNSKVLIARDATAEHIITTANAADDLIANRLLNISDNVGGISQSGEVELVALLRVFDNKWDCACIPYIKTYPKEIDLKEYSIDLIGYSIFNGSSLTGFISGSISRGLNWVKNKVESGIIVVKTKEDKNVSLEIIDAESKIIPSISNGKIYATIKVQMSSNIGEEEGTEDIFTPNALLFLEKQQDKVIKSEIQSVIAYAKKMHCDFLGIGNAIYHKYPAKWDKMKSKWEDLFPKVIFNVVIESSINRVYTIKQPTKNESDEN